MPKRPSLAPLISRIKRINARFRTLRDQDGPMADRLRSEKDALIDAMAAACGHPAMIAMAGRKHGCGKPSVPPLRLCERCGFCERPAEGTRVGRRPGSEVEVLPLEEYALRQGRALRRLGINV